MHYDASGVSPSEFKFGLSFLTRSIALARFPWLSACSSTLSLDVVYKVQQ
jgi:2',3'-cyclic-nucleotide 2'-phosphodiesterase (5'-nucleotidase family)